VLCRCAVFSVNAGVFTGEIALKQPLRWEGKIFHHRDHRGTQGRHEVMLATVPCDMGTVLVVGSVIDEKCEFTLRLVPFPLEFGNSFRQ
jgi:hypothetical protein